MNVRQIVFAALFCALPAVTAFAEDKPAKPGKPDPAAAVDRAELEKQFSERLTSSALVGTFSVIKEGEEIPSKPERYEIESVNKLKDDYWVFLARIKYGENDVKVPITLKVLWAGDTPVITLTELTIPPLGTFTARVMIYGDRYAGTWQHDQVGGHLWGRIEKQKTEGDKTGNKEK